MTFVPPPRPSDAASDRRISGGNEEVLVRHFFATTGWPSTVSTAEYGAFVGNVLAGKRRALDTAALRGDLPLKPGLEE